MVKKVIEIDVDVLNAKGGIDGLIKSFDEAEKSTKSLKQQMREAQNEVAELSEKFGATSDEAVKAAKRAGELKDRIGDAKALTEAFNPDAKFNALSSSLSGVASGFAAYQGALTLAGVESKDLEQQLLRVQSAMALAQGLQGLGEARDSFKQLKAVAIDAFKGIKTAIGSTGIGLLVIALGTVYAYWDDIKEAISGVSEEQKKLNADSQENLDLQNEKLKSIGAQDNILKLQGKSEKEILAIKIKQTDEAILATEINQKNQIQTNKLAVEGAQRNYELLKSYIDFVSTPLRFLYKTGAESINGIIDLLNKIPGINIKSKLDETLGDKAADYITKLGFDPEKVKADGEATIKESQQVLTQLKNDRAGYRLAINDIDTKSKEEQKQKDEERRKELEKQREQDLQDLKDFQAKIREAETEERLRVIDERFAKAENDLAWQKEIAEASDKIDEEFYQKKEQRRLKELEIEKAVADGKKAIQESTFQVAESGISLLKGLFEKNKAIQKGLLLAESAVGIAKIVVSTQAANAADTAAAALMGPAGVGYLAAKKTMNYISAGIGTAANIAATAKALSALGGGGAPSAGNTGGGGGAGGGGAISAPQFNVVGNTGINQIAQTMNKEQMPVQAYVVGNKVTSQQALDRNIVDNASL